MGTLMIKPGTRFAERHPYGRFRGICAGWNDEVRTDDLISISPTALVGEFFYQFGHYLK